MTRCAALGLEHGHIFGMAASVAAAGGEIAAWAEAGEPLAGRFAEAWPDASPSSVEAVLAEAAFLCWSAAYQNHGRGSL